METWIEREERYKGRIITLETGRVRLENGNEAEREVLRHPGAVAVVPYGDGVVTLVRQYRIAVEEELLEIPAGKLEGAEDPEHRGRVELEEETGLVAERFVPIGHIYPSAGVLGEKMWLYLAFDLRKTQQNLESDEAIEIVEMPLEEVRRRLADHSFIDAKSAVGLHRLVAYLDS